MSKQQNILILPGMHGTAELLQDLKHRLEKSIDVQIIEYPNDIALNYNELTEFVLGRTPKSPYIILGESFSGPIAIEVAAQDTTHVKGLILAATFAKNPMPVFFISLIKLFNPLWVPHKIIELFMMGFSGSTELRKNFKIIMSNLSEKVIEKRCIEAFKVNKQTRLSKLKCPVLYMIGKNDCLIPKRSVREIESALPECKTITLPGPHLFLTTHSEKVSNKIEEFCNQLN